MNRDRAKRAKRLIAVVAGAIVVVVVSSLTLLIGSASADARETVLRKVQMMGTYSCFENGYVDKEISGAGDFWTGQFSILDHVSNSSDYLITVPGYASSNSNLQLTCKQLFKGANAGGSSIPGLLNGKTYTLQNLGYVPAAGSTLKNTKCLVATYDLLDADGNSQGRQSTNEICFPVNEDGGVVIASNGELEAKDSPTPCDLPGCLSLHATSHPGISVRAIGSNFAGPYDRGHTEYATMNFQYSGQSIQAKSAEAVRERLESFINGTIAGKDSYLGADSVSVELKDGADTTSNKYVADSNTPMAAVK